ncbi:MAG: prolipoprotein diacylglyceryl transferase [Anaerolineae bacterium]|nr:prolipoprotein diacylglyceryl transferase [Anaerolineae bacterium]
MPESTIAFRFFSVPVYSLALVVGIALSVGIGVRRTALRPGVMVDLCLSAFAGAIVGARMGHVLLNWTYFADNLSEALRPGAGGLDWHGAVIGGLVGLALIAHWRRLALCDLLDALAPALPLLAFAGWLGCWGAVCGYGAEVDTLAHYPAFAAAETRDVYGIVAPRYNTQVFGMALSLALLILSVVLIRRGWLKYRRFWLLLVLLSAGMFGIGFFRGDYAPMVAGIRADQVVDMGMLVWGVGVSLLNRQAAKNAK